ncbi:homeobox protein NANOG-like [Atheta coriaria]|uniref:homeobox protein NANOG-like n=1 Tax=Dalotia coriaria TaxID=877792 RepID=UPI0031F40217
MGPRIEELFGAVNDEYLLELCNSLAGMSESEVENLLQDVNIDEVLLSNPLPKETIPSFEEIVPETLYGNTITPIDYNILNQFDINLLDNHVTPSENAPIENSSDINKSRKRKRENANAEDEMAEFLQFNQVKRSKRRPVFSKAQIAVLETAFAEDKYVNKKRQAYLSQKACMSANSVRMWFQNRRTKLKNAKPPRVEDYSKAYVFVNGGYVKVMTLMEMEEKNKENCNIVNF